MNKRKSISIPDKVSRSQVKAKILESQGELFDKIDELYSQRTFARKILDSSNNIISYLLPIYD